MKLMKLRKRDAKRIAKYLARNMDAMQLDVTLTRSAGDDAGKWGGRIGDVDARGIESLTVGYKDSEEQNKAVDTGRRWYSVKDFPAPNFSEEQTRAVDAGRDKRFEVYADVVAEKDEFGVPHCVVTGYVVEKISKMLNPNNFDSFRLTSSFILERTTDGELRIRFPFNRARDDADPR